MSTKKTAATATTVCAGCEKRDATIKRQAEELDACKLQSNSWFVKWLTMCRDGDAAHAEEVKALTAQRDALQSRIDSFIKTCADIRAVCVDAGIEHADKMATLTAVQALAENLNKSTDHNGMLIRELHQTQQERDGMKVRTLAWKDMYFLVEDIARDVTISPATERPSALPWIILALNLAILGRLLTM